MSQLYPTNAEAWPRREWMAGPLQLEKVAILPLEPLVVFTSFTAPEKMCRLFAWMHDIVVDNSAAVEANGLGAKRRCYFGNGMVLEEVIVGWEPPWRYAYRGVDETHPFGMVGHLGIIACRPLGEGTELIWQHYFDHPNPAAMCKQLATSMELALQRLRG